MKHRKQPTENDEKDNKEIDAMFLNAISDEHEHRHDVLEVDPPRDVFEVDSRCSISHYVPSLAEIIDHALVCVWDI